MIAQVIVDVPAGPTDRLFDYKVPISLQRIVERGMRVTVPFGPRKVQGFIVQLKATSEVPNLKNIIDIMDVTPILTEELLKLGDWLAYETLCYKITAYQSMLPAVFRAKYNKKVRLINEERMSELDGQLSNMFRHRQVVDWNEVIELHLLKPLKDGISEKILEIYYEVTDKITTKKIKVVAPINLDKWEDVLVKLDKRSQKQIQLMQFFLEHPEPIPLKELMEQTSCSRQTIKTLVEKKLLIENEMETNRDPYMHRTFQRTSPLPLTLEQKKVIDSILNKIRLSEYETFLLHGVTGSGKTEIYLQSIAEVLKDHKEAIVLVPEISLTPQMVQRFKERFGSQVAVLHSGLSMGEKYDEWRKIHNGKVKVVVGARSAIFAPFTNIGIIIIDEEHESTYKQEEHPRYHARDVAIERAKYYQCPLILGSATPSLESYARAQRGVYSLLNLSARVNQGSLPKVDIVDMREELKAGNRSMFSQALYEKLEQRLSKNEQSVLFLNRRGYSTFVMCRDCGQVVQCQNCDISLTYHQTNRKLKCHYCGYEERMPQKCPSCESEHIRYFGSGTQKVEEEITKVFPGARVIRMDVDTTRRKGSHEKLLTTFSEGKADILLGTQMIAKGLDFPNITLVGVLAADSMLHFPDFRSSERTFQLLTQVSGRAGRHQLPGEVVIQTYTPDHYSIEFAKHHDFFSFYKKEMEVRRTLGYPPYYYVTSIQVSHPNLNETVEVMNKIILYLKRNLSPNTIVLGPVVAPISRIKNRYRYQCMIKYKVEQKLIPVLSEITEIYKKKLVQGDLQIAIDRNPYVLM